MPLYDNTTLVTNEIELLALWWDSILPYDHPVYISYTESTDQDGVLEMSLSGKTNLNVGDDGFLLLYKLNNIDHRASLVFAGRTTIISL